MVVFEAEADFQEGALILVDKPFEWTSFDVVNKIRWSLKKNYPKLKVGHAGTLDPLATGLVIVCTGKWTKRIDSYMGKMKEYVAELCFGATTPSFDLETEIDGEYSVAHIDRRLLEEQLERFIGEIEQVPPAFSAVRIDGKRAYEKARKGIEQQLQTRKIYIKEIEVVRFELPKVVLRIVCGKGTYIRSLANDIGKFCGSGAYLSGLRRTVIGEYSIEQAAGLDDLIASLRQEDAT